MRLLRVSVALALMAGTCCTKPEPPPPATPAATVPRGPSLHDLQVPLTPAATVPRGPSLYVLQVPLTDQDGHDATLDVHRGHPVIISMFYASCPGACPVLIEEVKDIEAKLSPQERVRVRVLLVSFDPKNDTPASLKALAEQHHLDLSRWTLARTDESHVRDLAAALGIKYRFLPDGAINHSSVITVLDATGSPDLVVEGLGENQDGLVQSLKRLAG